MTAIKGFSQIQPDVKLTKKDGKYKIEYKEREFDANENILTIKPKDQTYLPKNLESVRKNKLGFIDVRIPNNKNIEEYANELQKTGLFETVEFNAYGEYVDFEPNDPEITNQWYSFIMKKLLLTLLIAILYSASGFSQNGIVKTMYSRDSVV